jgi:hypothetical protein
VVVVPARAPVAIYGCLRDFSWCDGSYQGKRGWLSARYLQLWYQGTYLSAADYARYSYLPIVAFNINTYWPRYYAGAPFYAELGEYASGGSVQVNIGSFYRPLAPHGQWVEIRGRYVWVPRVPANWRPYTNGRWAYTNRYGWTWVSNEPFGWATYHYGRWAYSPRLGWFWVPGTRWAPAWVAWRGSNDHLAWAPLPPDPEDSFGIGIGIDISFGNIPNYYWQAVPSQNFLDANLTNVVIGDNNQVTNIVNQTQVIGGVSIENNIVVNNVINIEYVEEKTQEEVVAREITLTSEAPEGGAVEGDVVSIYQPPAADLTPEAAPAEVTPVEQAEQESATAGQAADQPSTEELVPPPPPAEETPPPSDAPPVIGDSGEQGTIAEDPTEATSSTPAGGPLPANLPEPCPDGTIRLDDGSCAPPPDAPPPAEEVTPETAAPTDAPPPPQPAQPQTPADQPPPAEQAPPAAEQTPPATEAAPPTIGQEPPAPEDVPSADNQAPPPACPEGTVMQADGTCASPAPAESAEPPPAEQPAAQQPPLTAEEAPPPEGAASPPAEQSAPSAGQPQDSQLPPCPEGYVVNEQGVCVLPAQQ